MTNGAQLLLLHQIKNPNRFNQHWCLKTSAYGSIKFTSWERCAASPIILFSSAFTADVRAAAAAADVAWICIILATIKQNGNREKQRI